MGARVCADLVARGRQLAGELAEKGRLHEAAEGLCKAGAGFREGNERAYCWRVGRAAPRGCTRSSS